MKRHVGVDITSDQSTFKSGANLAQVNVSPGQDSGAVAEWFFEGSQQLVAAEQPGTEFAIRPLQFLLKHDANGERPDNQAANANPRTNGIQHSPLLLCSSTAGR